jgi:hypothetical protein
LWTAICPISGSGLSPAHCQPFYLSSVCLLKVPSEIRSFALPLSLVCSKHPSAACPFQFLIYYSGFFAGQGSVFPLGCAGLSRGSCGNTACRLLAHLLVCISQAGLEPVSGGTGALLFSQCNMVWRSFVWAGGSVCRSFDSLWWIFFCQVWLQHLSKIFDLWSSLCLLLPSSHYLGFPPYCFTHLCLYMNECF